MRFSDSIILFLSLASNATGYTADPVKRRDFLSHATPAEEGSDHDVLKPFTHTAYHRVEDACAADVEKLCSTGPTTTTTTTTLTKEEGGEDRELVVTPSSSSAPPPSYGSSAMILGGVGGSIDGVASADPFLDMLFYSTTPLSEDLTDQFMDQLFYSILSYSTGSSSSIRGSGTYSSNTFYYSSPSSSSSFAIYEELSPSIIIDYGVARLASEKEPEEIPMLAAQLQSYGAGILLTSSGSSSYGGAASSLPGGGSSSDCPFRTQMARRLTEMDSTTIPQLQYHVRLPFGPTQNTCLKTAFEQQNTSISAACAAAISRLETTFLVEEVGHTYFSRFAEMMVLCDKYIILCLMLLVVLSLSYKQRRRQENSNEYINVYYLHEDDESCEEEEEEIDDDYHALLDETKNNDTTIVIYEGVPIQMV